MAIAPDGKELWVVNQDHGSVTALRILDKVPHLAKIAEIGVGRRPRTLAFSPDGVKVYVTGQWSHSLAVVDRVKKAPERFVALGWGTQPYGVIADPEGKRLYVSLYAKAQVAVICGSLFWFGRADEVQDLEGGIRAIFGGRFIRQDLHPSLGEPNAGRSEDLDRMADYVTSLDRVRESPYRAADGRLTQAARRGRDIFYGKARCTACHPGHHRFADSAIRDAATGRKLSPKEYKQHELGTTDRYSGAPEGGYDTATLVGVWETGPWLHDGRAASMREVLTKWNRRDEHGLTQSLSGREVEDLAHFVLSIDEGSDVTPAAYEPGRCPNRLPLVRARYVPSRVAAGQPAAFLGSESSDPDGNIRKWVWRSGDGTDEVDGSATVGDVVHIFPGGKRATYRVTLEAADDRGGVARRSWRIRVGTDRKPGSVRHQSAALVPPARQTTTRHW